MNRPKRILGILLIAIAVAVATTLAVSIASAANRTPWTGYATCSSTASAFPSSSTTALQEWSAINYSAVTVWIGTGTTITTGPNGYGVILSNGGVFTSHLANPNKVYCKTASATVLVPIWGEY